MARYVGIDIGTTQVKVAVVRGNVRRYAIERLVAIDRATADVSMVSGAPLAVQTLDEVMIEAAKEPSAGGDPLTVGFAGARTYVRTIDVPPAVRRRLAEVLPFELEAQLPFDLDEAVYDHRLRPGVASALPQPVLVAAARTTDVRELIDRVKRTVGREPDHVVPGAFAFADLASALPPFKSGGVRAILDLGYDEGELVVLDGVEPVYARTLSRGVTGMPASAGELAREIRQTFAAHRASGGEAPTEVYLTGGGALVPELARWLAGELQMTIEPLPLAAIDGLLGRADAHRFSRAIGLALGASPRRRGMDLRKGPLAFERGYGFLREKVPLLAGLGGALLVTFFFATWARARNVTADRAVLEDVLQQTTKEVFGEATSSPERIDQLLGQKATVSAEEDPLPRADAMDVLVQLSELIPADRMKHDVEKLEVTKLSAGGFKVIIQGIAPSGADVSTIESLLKGYRCFNAPTVTKKTKAISDDREKYTLETELRCPEEGGGQKPATNTGASSAGH